MGRARARHAPWLERRSNGSWCAYWYEPSGRRVRRKSLGTTDEAVAQELFAQWLADRHRVAATAEGPLNMDAVFDFYRKHHVYKVIKDPKTGGERPKVIDRERIENCLKRLRPFFGKMTPGSIDILSGDAYADMRRERDGAGDGTIRRELVCLIAAANFGGKRRLFPRTEVPDLELPEAPEPRDRWLRRAIDVDKDLGVTDELGTLLETAMARHPTTKRASRIERFILLAYYLASRKTAIEQLTWFQVDFVRETIDLNPKGRRQTKKRRPRVAIPPELLPRLRAWKEQRVGEYVLDHKGSIRSAFEKLMVDCGFNDVTPHTLRHTRATHLAQDGMSIVAIAQMLGDSVITTAKTYLKHCPEHTRREFRELMNRQEGEGAAA